MFGPQHTQKTTMNNYGPQQANKPENNKKHINILKLFMDLIMNLINQHTKMIGQHFMKQMMSQYTRNMLIFNLDLKKNYIQQ